MEIVLVWIQIEHPNNKSFLHNSVFSKWDLPVVGTLPKVIFRLPLRWQQVMQGVTGITQDTSKQHPIRRITDVTRLEADVNQLEFEGWMGDVVLTR